MTTTIALSGKGGTGKTTLCALMIRSLVQRRLGSLLAVDADPNACLALTLGAPVIRTVSEIREQTRAGDTPAGMDRVRSFEYGIQQVISEQPGYDLLTMGRPEGPSCYCAANNLLRRFLDQLSHSYRFVMIDNEAGMEHLSRRTTNHVDLLCIVSETTTVGAVTARRIRDLAHNLPIEVKRLGVIWNRAAEPRDVDGVETLGCVPHDPALLEAARHDRTVFDLDHESPALLAVQEILDRQLRLEPVAF